jgi:transcriptional regulator with XRE-family HTH domain
MKHPRTFPTLQEWLTEAAETPRTLAKKLGITAGNVNRWLSGKRTPPPYLELALRQLDSMRPIPTNDLEAQIAALRGTLTKLVAMRPAQGERFCRYRKCKALLKGQRNQEFCNSSCRASEHRARKEEKN